ncbi:MAG TPA: hypothetical protein VH092_19315 [Urbifossiella sp.]|nr:hypothetical protein [Urbifossiella sp.]
MTPDDEDDGFDPADADPEVRELRERVRELEATALRHTAVLDQLWAKAAATEAEAAAVRAEQAELRAAVDALEMQVAALHARWARTRRLYR